MNKETWGGHDATFHVWHIVGPPLMPDAQESGGCIWKRNELIKCTWRVGLKEPDAQRQISAQYKEFCASGSSNVSKSTENFPAREVF